MRHLLLQLFNLFLGPMLFAAGATVLDGAGGGDGTGGDSGIEGDIADVSDADESGTETISEGDVDVSETDAEANADPDAPVDLGDGRTVPGKWKKLFDQATKAGLGKEAKQLYFAQQRLLKAIPGGINQAIQLAQTVEELGGVEGIEQLQSDLDSYSDDAERFNSGDARWIESSFTENPEVSLKHFAHALDYVAEHHAEHYDHLMAKVIVNDLGNLDVREMHALLAGIKDNPRAAQLAKELADYYNSRREAARKVPEKKPDAQNKALSEKEKKVEQREMNVRFTEVNREVFPALKSSVTKALQSEAKAVGLDLAKVAKEYPGEWRDLLNDIHQRLMREASKDQRFIDKHYALVKKGDLKRAAQAVNQKHDRIIQNTAIVQDAMKERGLFRGKKNSAAAGDKKNQNRDGGGGDSASQNQGWQTVSKRPENSAINWKKTSTALQLDGKYILNDGKKVVVKY